MMMIFLLSENVNLGHNVCYFMISFSVLQCVNDTIEQIMKLLFVSFFFFRMRSTNVIGLVTSFSFL